MSRIEDAAAARRLGITYGRYMTEVKRSTVIPKKDEGNGFTCTLCGAPLHGRQREYCTTCKDIYIPKTL